MDIAVSELIVRFMERLGIRVIFGMPGAHILPVYDHLHSSAIRSILVKHEQGAAFMAGGYARTGGGIAACLTTAGPGATNLITGVANAYADRQPLLIITGETSTHIFGRGGLQESSGEGGTIDQSALFAGITRYSKTVERTDYLAQVLNRAAKVLRSANPGPVLLSFPFNVQNERVDPSILDGIGAAPAGHCPRAPAPLVTALVDLLEQARNPVLVAGYGCIRSGAQAMVAHLSESLRIPVATSLKGKGVVDERSALALGCLGVTSGGHAYKYIVEHADLVVFLGAAFNERTSYLWDGRLLEGKKVAQIDSDPEQLERVFVADVAIHGDIGQVLTAVAARLAEHAVAPKHASATGRHDGRLWSGGPGRAPGGHPDFRLMEQFFARLAREFPHEALIVDDNIIFAQNFLHLSPSVRYYPNSGISSLGHAIPAAIGARFALACPTFAILGDGGFQMCCMELMTAVNYGIPLNVVVLNNGSMGLIRKNQFQLYGGRFIDCDFVNPDFAHLARAFGIHHRRVADEAAIDALFCHDDLSGSINLIEIPLDKNAFPNYLSGR